MSNSGRPSSAPSGGSTDNVRQLALLALCVLGLLVAAFAMPTLSGMPPGEAGEGGGGGTSTPTPSGSGGEGGEPSGTGSGEGESGGDGGSDGNELTDGGVIFDGDNPPEEGCVIALEGRRAPGARMLVHVWRDGYPVPNQAVWFNDRRIGFTDTDGKVMGTVPYRRELRVDVSMEDESSCSVVHAEDYKQTDEDLTGASFGGFGASDGVLETKLPSKDGNVSEKYEVTGTTNVSIIGDPYPGKTVTVSASVKDVPMRDAAVVVDGEQVGRTDERGHYSLRIPADGTRSVEVVVSRGDFSGSTTVRVPPLRVKVVPSSMLPVPGTQAIVRVTFGEQPAPNVPVSVDGERLGTTAKSGAVPYRLASDPGTTVQVRAAGQVATTSLWPAYASTILIVGVGGLLVVGSLVTAFRRNGRRTASRVGVGWVVVGFVTSGFLVGGRTGGLTALALVTLAGVGALIKYRGDEIAAGVRSFGNALARLVQWVLAQTLQAARALEAFVLWARDALVDVREWLGTLPRSASALAARAAAWLREIPSRVRAICIQYYEPRAIATVAFVLAVVTAATIVGGATGFLASVGLLTLVGIAVLLRRHQPESEESTTADRPRKRESSISSASNDQSQPSLRERWRTFARWVVPRGWRQRTPGEVSRAAIERGFPRESVAQFTWVFREVEFGDRPLSTDRERRATEAYERLELAERGDEGSEEP